MIKKEIFLCSIGNVLSGLCSEDCKFCSQSSRYRAKIKRYSFKKKSEIIEEAKKAKSNGATGYCLVTAGGKLTDNRLEYISSLSYQLKKYLPNMRIIACNGIASKEALKELKKSGVHSYNHNLETSKEYYREICSTHLWEQRYQTCENVKSVGLKLCSGGIFGMGEAQSDRDSLIKSIISLKPEAIPINFFIPNPSLPIKKRNIDVYGALEIIKKFKSLINENIILMVAGGREALFLNREREMFEAGVNSIVIGDYLTTKGVTPDYDKMVIESLGYSIARECDE